jgi:hypothetical protein
LPIERDDAVRKGDTYNMKTTQRIGATVLAAVMVLSVLTAATGPVAAAANPTISVTSAPSTVGPDSSFQIEYEIENTGDNQGAFTAELPNLPSGVAVESIEGDIQASNVDGTPPSATTDNTAANGGTVSVTVTYNLTGAATGDADFELTARSPIDGTSDSESTSVTVQQPVAVPSVSATGGDDVVAQGGASESTYEIENTGTAAGAFTVRTADVSSGITINSIEGDVQSSDVDGTPPSATTDSAAAGGAVEVTVNYSVATDAQLGSYSLFTLAVEEPTTGATDNASASVTVQELVAVPSVSATGGDNVVRQGSAYESTYEIENTGTAAGSFTVRTADVSSGITINSIEGDVQSSDVDGTPPSATTDSAAAGGAVEVTVNYSVATDAQLDSYPPFTLAVEEPINGATDNASASVTVKQPAPEEATDRALEVSGKSDASEVEQNDVTVAITRFDRSQTANGIKLSQNDITVLITLFERSN